MKRNVFFAVFLFLLPGTLCRGVQTEFLQSTKAAMAANDTLEDVYPVIDTPSLAVSGISEELVNGRADVNGVMPIPDNRTVTITWDLGESALSPNVYLEKVDLWLQGNDWLGRGSRGNFTGHLEISRDGRKFITLPGTVVKKAFKKESPFNVIRLTFSPGEVKDFRFLRVVSNGYQGCQSCFMEIDGWVAGAQPVKSSEINTQIRPMEKKEPVVRIPCQVVPAPMQVHPLKFAGDNLVLSDGTAVLKRLRGLVPFGWSVVKKEESPKNLTMLLRRQDGLLTEKNWTIDLNNRVTVRSKVSLPAGNAPVEYDATVLEFEESDIEFDGLKAGQYTPVFLPRQFCTMDLGNKVPYLVFPAAKKNVELQFYMPAWTHIPGRVDVFDKNRLTRWTWFSAVNNPVKGNDNSRWKPRKKILQSGESLAYQIHLALFAILPRTLGQMDIEEHQAEPAAFGINNGNGNQQISGATTVFQRDKMIFMGYRLPEGKPKLGHQITVYGIQGLTDPFLDRMARAGVGMLVIQSSDFLDASHGVSWDADYDKAPPGFREVLRKIHARGIKALVWYSPRGFYNSTQDPARPRPDPTVKQHPDWFLKDTHWMGMYQNVNPYADGANRWIEAKIRQDLTRFPELDGIAVDTFPGGGTLVGPDGRTTATYNDLEWMKRFYAAVKSAGKEKLYIYNSNFPCDDEFNFCDYSVTEHPQMMFMNDVTGRSPYGRMYCSFGKFAYTNPGFQLGGWCSPLRAMYHNFCGYDQAQGWNHTCYMMLDGRDINGKSVDKHIAPLWYIMGKGKRVFGAEIQPGIRQIEANLPDGTKAVILCSMASRTADVRLIPQTLAPTRYRVTGTVDNATKHLDLPALTVDLSREPGLAVQSLPPFSIMVFRFAAE
jgi:hypothetical protein